MKQIRLIGDRNSPNRDFNLLQIKTHISVAEKKLESLEEARDLEPTEMEDKISLEEVIVDSSSDSNFIQKSLNPPVPDVSDEVFGSFPATNHSHKSGESQMTGDEIVFKSKSISLDSDDLNSVEGNFRSTPLIVLSAVNGSGDVDEIQEHKVTSLFLDYQEGKPFNCGSASGVDDVGFQARRAIENEVKNLSSSKGFTRISSTLPASDKGNCKSKPKSVFCNGFGVTCRVQDYNSLVMKLVYLQKIQDGKLNVHKVLFIVDNKLYSGKRFCCSFELARTLFDRGKWVELIRMYSHYKSKSSKFSFDMLEFGLLVRHWLMLMHPYDASFVSELNSEHGYHFLPLLLYSGMCLFVINGISGNDCKFCEEMLQQDKLLRTEFLSQSSRETAYVTAPELFDLCLIRNISFPMEKVHRSSMNRLILMSSSWTVHLVLGVSLLVWTDAHALLNLLKYTVYEIFSIRARVGYYVRKDCNTRSQSFDYFYTLRRRFLPYIIDITKFDINGESGDTRKVIEEMVPPFIILGTGIKMRLQMTSQSGFGCSHEVFDPCLGRDSSFSTQMERVRRDFVTTILNSIQKLQSSSTKTTAEFFYSKMGNLSSARCILVFSGRVVDRGRFPDSYNSNFCLNILIPCKSILMGSTGVKEYNGNLVHELSLAPGNCSEWLWEYSIVQNGVQNSMTDKLKDIVIGILNQEDDAAQMFHFVVTQMGILIKALRTILGLIKVLLVIKGNGDLMLLQQDTHKKLTSPLHCIFEFSSTNESGSGQFLKQVYQAAVEWYSQVNTLYTLEAGVRRLHVYTVIVLLSAESYCDILKLKRVIEECNLRKGEWK